MNQILPTQLIYQAIAKAPKIKIKKTKEGDKFVEYSDIKASPVNDGLCWLCGGETGGVGVPTKKVIKQTFTDRDLSRAPESKSVCKPCAFCLSFGSLRNYSIIATENWLMHPDRENLRGWLLRPPNPPFVICVATSGQKWLHIRSEVAHSRNSFPVQFEETRIYVDGQELKNILDPVEILYSNGFSKAEIETGTYGQKRIIDYGLREWRQEEEKIRLQRGNRLFALAVFVARRQEDLKRKKEEDLCFTTALEQPTGQKQRALF